MKGNGEPLKVLEGHELLGSYVFTQVQLNPGLGEDDFRF